MFELDQEDSQEFPMLGAMSASSAPAITSTARAFFGINALAAWIGLAVAFTYNLLGTYPNLGTDTTLFGFNQAGAAGAIGRLGDFFAYFTNWSNIVVGIVMTLLWRQSSRTSSKFFAVMRIDSLIMITVTGLVYALVLAPLDNLQGWQYVSNTFVHYITPILTILVFIVFGPRKQMSLRLILPSLILPLIWVAFTLLRGLFIDAYPYGFINVAKWGYGTVSMNIVGVVIVGVLVGLIFVGIDRIASRSQRAE